VGTDALANPGGPPQPARHEPLAPYQVGALLPQAPSVALKLQFHGSSHVVQLHELLTYLGQAGVATLMITGQLGLIGAQMRSPVDASYLADAVVLLRYFEAEGEVKQAISVLKKRGGAHERAIREFEMTPQGIRIGEALRRFRGILTGSPVPVQ